MLISETVKLTGLTKKAIEYYIEQGLTEPALLDNGYRDFSEADLERLKKIAVLRKLGVGTDRIKSVLEDKTGDVLSRISLQKELSLQREQARNAILDKLRREMSYEDITPELEALDRSTTITEKLLEAFPGSYGRFVCLHFARFLNEPVTTAGQQEAYLVILEFLDNVPPLDIPQDLFEYLEDSVRHLQTQDISDMLTTMAESYKQPDQFLTDNKEFLEQYLAYRQSDEFRDSLNGRLLCLMKRFNSASGYNDVFLPAMKRLSGSYSAYYSSMEAANEILLERYPDIADL